MKYTNAQMKQMLDSLDEILERTDVIGYAAARNHRILSDELQEYIQRLDAYIVEYGEEQDGGYAISSESGNFKAFAEAIEKFASIEHEPNLFKLKFSEAIGNLSGTQLLRFEWMFED
jgi:uncharacterized UPF0160 family protein